MTTLSLTDYAATHGVTKQSASEWKTRGYLVMDGDKVDVEASDRQMAGWGKGRFRIKTHGGKRREGVRGVVDRPGLALEVPPPAHSPKSDPEQDAAEAYCSETGIAAQLRDAWAQDDAELFEEHAALIAWGVMNDDREVVRWSRWPAKVAPEIASALGIADRVGEVQAALQTAVAHRLLDFPGVGADDLATIEAELIAAGATIE